MSGYDWLILAFVALVGLSIVIADKTRLHQKVLSWSTKRSPGTPSSTLATPTTVTPTSTTGGFGALWKKWVHENPLVVGLASLALVIAVVSIMYGGLGWLWIKPKLTGSVIVVMIAMAALPAFKPNPGGTAKKAIYLSIGLILFWNLPVLGGGLGLEQVFNPKAEQVGIHAETLRDITVSVTSDPDHPLVVNPDEWSKWVWLGSNYNWGVGSEDDRPFWIMTSSGKPQLHDSKNGKVATFNAGQANRFASGDTKPLKLFFRRKGLAK